MTKFTSPCPPPTPQQARATWNLIGRLLTMAQRMRDAIDHQPVSPYRTEIMTILAEECCEAVQRATKLLRFGVEEKQPDQPYTNAERLGLEIGDVETMLCHARRLDLFLGETSLHAAISDAIEEGIMTIDYIHAGKTNKESQLAKFLQSTGKA